jgi:hypothetical protein
MADWTLEEVPEISSESGLFLDSSAFPLTWLSENRILSQDADPSSVPDHPLLGGWSQEALFFRPFRSGLAFLL